jgi:glycosyltransferase involved in cell wall biosynthesis
MKPRVVYWNNIPAPYMVERFSAVVERGNVDLEVWFSTRTEADRSWQVAEECWRFPYRYLPSIPGRRTSAIPLPALRARPEALVSLYATPSFIVGSTAARLRGIRIAYWVGVTFDAWITRRSWKERLKSALLPRADGVLTAGRDGAAFATRYGVPPERIFMVPHVIDFDRYAEGTARARASRDKLRSQLGLDGVTFAYVGRLWSGKGLDQLLDAFGALQRENARDVSLLLVGEGTDEARSAQTVRGRAARASGLRRFSRRRRAPPALRGRECVRFSHLGGSLRDGRARSHGVRAPCALDQCRRRDRRPDRPGGERVRRATWRR